MKTCGRCKAKLEGTEKICPRCGSDINQPNKLMYPGELTDDTEIID